MKKRVRWTYDTAADFPKIYYAQVREYCTQVELKGQSDRWWNEIASLYATWFNQNILAAGYVSRNTIEVNSSWRNALLTRRQPCKI